MTILMDIIQVYNILYGLASLHSLAASPQKSARRCRLLEWYFCRPDAITNGQTGVNSRTL